MDAGAEGAERRGVVRVDGRGPLELGDGRAVGGTVERSRRDEVGEDADAVDLQWRETGGVEESDQALDVEAAGQRVGLPPAAVRAGERLAGLADLTGEGLGEDDGEPAGDEEGQVALGGEDGGDPGQGGRGVVDDLEDAVAADEVDALALLERRAVGVALSPGDAVGDAEVGGAAVEGGEGVGAGVDDDDVVAELGERDGQASRTATEVEDPQRAAELRLLLRDELARSLPR